LSQGEAFSAWSNREDCEGADAHQDDGTRFVVRADAKLTAFVELESQLAVKKMDF
jgi:hypothetical protein